MVPVVLFREKSGRVPFLEWFDRLSIAARRACRRRLEMLAADGHQLRRPNAAYLRDGIYELRFRVGTERYRVLYFFRGREAVIVSHGLLKLGAAVPAVEIDRARRHLWQFAGDPARHSHHEELP